MIRPRLQPGGPRWLRRLRRTTGRAATSLLWNLRAPLRALAAARERRRIRRVAKGASGPRVLATVASAVAGLAHGARASVVLLWRLVSRGDVRQLVQGVPALLVGGLVGTIAGAAVLTSDVPLTSRYKRAADRAMADGERALAKADRDLAQEKYQTAALYYERLAQLDSGTPETRFAMARTAEALDQPDRARAIMLKLAPPDGGGYGPAHLWLARHLVETAGGNPARLQAARPHVTRVLADEPDALAHALAARIFAGLGQLETAEVHLVEAIGLDPPDAVKSDLRVSLARIYVLQNKHALARPEAEAALGDLRRRGAVEPANHTLRFSWADAALFLELFDETQRVLEDGMALDLSQQPRLAGEYASRMSQLYITKATVLGRQGKADLAEQLELMSQALRFNPKNQAALAGVMNISRQRGPAADAARASLKDALADGVSPATAHFILGNIAWDRGEPEVARRELEVAYRLDPTMPDVGNNLAWYISQSEPPDLSRALNIINGVVEIAPEHPAYRETRGQILVKLGRWSDALVDLEFALDSALPVIRENPGVHRALATAYRNLGDVEMATRHEQRAAGLAEAEATSEP